MWVIIFVTFKSIVELLQLSFRTEFLYVILSFKCGGGTSYFFRNILVNTLVKEKITLEFKRILMYIHQV